MGEMLEQTVENLCQENTDDDGKCYSYFYKTMTVVVQWFLDSQRPGGRGRNQCTTMDYSGDEVTFESIKAYAIDKFCDEDCQGIYQDVLLGCCSASMIKDEGEKL